MYPQPTYLTAPPDGVIRKGKMPVRAQYQTPTGYSGLQHNPAYGKVGKAGKVALLGAGAVGLVGLVLLPSLVLYPWVIKKFKPKWSYGKRVGAGFAIGIGTSMIKSALTPPEVKLAREQERIKAAADRREAKLLSANTTGYSGWAPRTWFQGGWKADLGEQQGWAEAQLDRAQAGSALTSIYGPGCCTTGGGDITSTSFTQSPTHINGMHTRSAYYLALTARVAMGAGWSQDAIQELIKAADDTLAASRKDYYNPEDPTIIQAGFQEDIDLITKLGAQNPPLPNYADIIQKLANMGNLESISFAQEQDVAVVAGTVKGILADIQHKVGLGGEGGALVRAEAAKDEKRRQNMTPVLIVGGVALAATIGYVFLKKD
jgi:hypothetical protein